MNAENILGLAFVIMVSLGGIALIQKCDKRIAKSNEVMQAETVKKQALICKKVYPQLTFQDCVYVLSK